MKDYEQLYYDSQYEVKQLKKKIKELEIEIEFFKKSKNKGFNIRKEIIKEINEYLKKGRC